ncbi:hypothetical protein [Streptomyces sp. NPDC059071]|uniref:hypothetical protein n=1 Tax=Streptomyces sp. NPDC059071 TaxID=3346714 RepID=UPI003681B04E
MLPRHLHAGPENIDRVTSQQAPHQPTGHRAGESPVKSHPQPPPTVVFAAAPG